MKTIPNHLFSEFVVNRLKFHIDRDRQEHRPKWKKTKMYKTLNRQIHEGVCALVFPKYSMTVKECKEWFAAVVMILEIKCLSVKTLIDSPNGLIVSLEKEDL